MTLSENSCGGEKELLMGRFGGEEVGQYQPPRCKVDGSFTPSRYDCQALSCDFHPSVSMMHNVGPEYDGGALCCPLVVKCSDATPLTGSRESGKLHAKCVMVGEFRL